MIKHIFFDLDHTLWDFEANSAQAFKKIFELNYMNISLLKFLEYYKPINQHYWKLYRNEKVAKHDLRYGRLRDTFLQMNFEIKDDLIYKLSKEYIDHLPNYNKLFEGTTAILDYLKPKYSLHIITNGFNEIQRTKLIKSNIVQYFDKIITSEAVGVKKPNPRIFNYALQITNALPKQSIMIGDNLEADVLGAMNVDMKAILFNTDSKEKIKEITSINKLEELRQFL